MTILNRIKSAYNSVKTTLFHPKTSDAIKTVRNSVFLATLGATGAAQASISHNSNLSTVQQTGTSEFQAVKMYEVQSGDSLDRIAKRNNIKTELLLELNPTIKNKDLIFLGQKVAIPVDVNQLPIDDNSVFDDVVIVGKNEEEYNTESKKKSPDTSEGPSEYNFEIALKNGLHTDKISMKIIFEYVKGFYPKVFDSKNKKLIIETFIQDYKIYSNNSVLNEVESMQSILGEEKDIQIAQFLSQAGYDGLEIQDVLKTMLVVETSGGLGKMYIAQAMKAKTPELQNELIDKAVLNFVGNAGDSGFYHAIGPWIQHEIDVQKLEGVTYIPGKERLRNQLRAVIQKGIEEKRTVEDMIKVMAKLDTRFDVKKMSQIVGNWFIRTHNSLNKYNNLSDLQKIQLTFIGYNRGNGAMHRRADKVNEGGSLKMTNDLRKRLSVMNTYKIDNDFQIAHADAKKSRNDILPPAYLQALSTSDKVALAMGQTSLNQKQSEIIASKYSSPEFNVLDGLEKTFENTQINPGDYNQNDIQKLQSLIANLKSMDVKDIADILGIQPDKLTDTQKKVIEKILKAPGKSPTEKLHDIILSTRKYYFHLAQHSSNDYYKELVVKLDNILATLELQQIVSYKHQYAA